MHTEIYTYFTDAPFGESKLLYSAETWVRVELQLETPGPVAVSTRQDVVPVLSGKGVLLPPDGEPIKFILPKGDRVFIASESFNRVRFFIEPIPWLEQILFQIEQGFGGTRGILGGLVRALVKSRKPATEEPPCPPPPRIPPGIFRR